MVALNRTLARLALVGAILAAPSNTRALTAQCDVVSVPGRDVPTHGLSHDGSTIVYARSEMVPIVGFSDIFLLDMRASLDRLVERRVTNNGRSWLPSLNPSGSIVAWLEEDDVTGEWKPMSWERHTLQPVRELVALPATPPPVAARISPDGWTMAVVTAPDASGMSTLWVTDANQSRSIVAPFVELAPAGEVWLEGGASFVVALGVQESPGQPINKRITKIKIANMAGTPVSCGPSDRLGTVTWTPTSLIRYISVRGGQTTVRSVPVTGNCLSSTVIGNLGSTLVLSAATSIDGTKVLVSSTVNDEYEVRALDAGTGVVETLTDHQAYFLDGTAALAPWPDENAQVAFYSMRTDILEPRILRAVNVVTPAVQALPHDLTPVPPFDLDGTVCGLALPGVSCSVFIRNSEDMDRNLVLFQEVVRASGGSATHGPMIVSIAAGEAARIDHAFDPAGTGDYTASTNVLDTTVLQDDVMFENQLVQ